MDIQESTDNYAQEHDILARQRVKPEMQVMAERAAMFDELVQIARGAWNDANHYGWTTYADNIHRVLSRAEPLL
jgi:hypothetical protein